MIDEQGANSPPEVQDCGITVYFINDESDRAVCVFRKKQPGIFADCTKLTCVFESCPDQIAISVRKRVYSAGQMNPVKRKRKRNFRVAFFAGENVDSRYYNL
jgi:hypothetical protein